MKVSKDSIDLGIIVTDEKAALAFYRDGLGLDWEGELPLPGGRMYRLKCGTTVIKLLKLEKTPSAKPAPGGPMGGLGLRYFTISVPDIRGLMSQLEAKGIRATVPVTEFLAQAQCNSDERIRPIESRASAPHPVRVHRRAGAVPLGAAAISE